MNDLHAESEWNIDANEPSNPFEHLFSKLLTATGATRNKVEDNYETEENATSGSVKRNHSELSDSHSEGCPTSIEVPRFSNVDGLGRGYNGRIISTLIQTKRGINRFKVGVFYRRDCNR